MRIVAGEWRGRRLKAPAGDRVRPTADRVREAWMSIVAGQLPGARVLDLFAGSGALGLEALSRGAAHCVFVDAHPASLSLARENASALGALDRCTFLRSDVFRFLDGCRPLEYGVGFADPPYHQEFASRIATRWIREPFAAVLGIEHAATETLPEGGDRRRYGDSAITFYRD